MVLISPRKKKLIIQNILFASAKHKTHIVSKVIANTIRFLGQVSIIFKTYFANYKTENIFKNTFILLNIISFESILS